jgi:hypothetical protein
VRVAAPGPHVVQVHVTSRPEAAEARDMQVLCNGEALGSAEVSAGHRWWRTVQFPVTLASDTATVEVRVERPLLREETGAQVDYGVRINEVSVLPPGSPLLRRARAATSR